MTRSRPITSLLGAAAIPLIALAVAACGGGAAATASPPPAPTHAKTSATATPTVHVAKSSLGKILVDSTGQTLYLFKADVGKKSACTGACAAAWPPLLAKGKPTAGTGLTASKLGTITRPDGSRQVTYNGHPLYLFIKDHKPGDVSGEGVSAFGAAWFVVSPAGNQVSRKSSHQAPVAASPAAKPQPAPKTVTQPAPQPAPTSTTQPAAPPAPPATTPAPPAAKPAPPANSGIPQNGGGDGDSDNNGGPSDGDGNI